MTSTTSPGRSASSDHRRPARPNRAHGRRAGRRQGVVQPRHVRAAGEARGRPPARSTDVGQRGMQVARQLAQLQHVAEHGDAPAGRLAEHGQGRAHRGRVGVVALVEQQRPARRRRRSGARSPRPAGGRRSASERRRAARRRRPAPRPRPARPGCSAPHARRACPGDRRAVGRRAIATTSLCSGGEPQLARAASRPPDGGRR